jgi:hypothetical protein
MTEYLSYLEDPINSKHPEFFSHSVILSGIAARSAILASPA